MTILEAVAAIAVSVGISAMLMAMMYRLGESSGFQSGKFIGRREAEEERDG